MTNLLEETLEAIKGAGLFPDAVSWVGSRDGAYGVDWDQFVSIANVEYDSGYGGQEIASDLVVVFKHQQGWLERQEYDGSEGWVHQKRPILQNPSRAFSRVKGEESWMSLAEIVNE